MAETLLLGLQRNWSPEEMQHLKYLLMESLDRSELKLMFDSLAVTVERHRLCTGFASQFPRSMQRVRLKSNPFLKNLAIAEQTMDRVRRVVDRRTLPIISGHAQSPLPPPSLLALACLSAIAHFHLLDSTLLVALVKALAARAEHLLVLSDGIILPVGWGDRAQAERRLYFPDHSTGELL